MSYNTTIMQGTNILTIVNGANDLVDGLLGISVLLMLFVIVFVSSLKYGAMQAFGTSMFFTGVVGIMFIVSGFIDQGIFVYIVIGMSVSGAFLWLKGANM